MDCLRNDRCKQLFSAKELTIDPGVKCTLKDPGASGWITVQGKGRIGKLALQTPAMINFGQNTEDEVFISYDAATSGVEIENTGSEPLVGLRYFGPDCHPNLPRMVLGKPIAHRAACSVIQVGRTCRVRL